MLHGTCLQQTLNAANPGGWNPQLHRCQQLQCFAHRISMQRPASTHRWSAYTGQSTVQPPCLSCAVMALQFMSAFTVALCVL
jgi:hypothetical protein